MLVPLYCPERAAPLVKLTAWCPGLVIQYAAGLQMFTIGKILVPLYHAESDGPLVMLIAAPMLSRPLSHYSGTDTVAGAL